MQPKDTTGEARPTVAEMPGRAEAPALGQSAAPALVHLAILLLRAFVIVLLALPFVLLAAWLWP